MPSSKYSCQKQQSHKICNALFARNTNFAKILILANLFVEIPTAGQLGRFENRGIYCTVLYLIFS